MEHLREEQLALYAGGDLPFQENSVVASHVGSCGQCQKMLAEFHETRSFITTSLQSPEASELSKVRACLRAKLQSQRSSKRHWAWWGAGVAAALALFVLPRGFEHQPVVVQKVEPVTAPSILTDNVTPGLSIRLPLTPIAASHPRHSKSREAGIRAITLIAQEDQKSIMKIVTADPDVVILWQSNDRTEHEP